MTESVSGPMAVWFCAEEWELGLIEELQSHFPGKTFSRLSSGVVGSVDFHPTRPGAEIFTRFFLPEVHLVSAASHKDTLKHLGPLVDAVLDPSAEPWTTHFSTPGVFTLDGEEYKSASARACLLSDLFLERMRSFRRRTMERHIEEKAFRRGLVVQVWVLGREHLLVAVTRKNRGKGSTAEPLFSHPAHRVPVDPNAPCRSYYKLEEALRVSGSGPRPGENCVDLGAAPGGWTWAALKRGARVIAVDAADLAEHVAAHPKCDHRRENGFSYLPPHPVDWMFCDMITKPLAALGLLERWLEARACKHFVVNIKFRGREPGSFLTEVERLKTTFELTGLKIRHLYYDRSEITLIHAPERGSR